MTPAVLLDANVLLALVHAAHVHHASAQRWMSLRGRQRWASCAITQLAFVRVGGLPQIGGPGASPARAVMLLRSIVADKRHEYWDDSPSPLDLRTLHSAALVGQRQVTDAYLLGLALERKAALATLDHGLQSFAAACGLDRHVEWIGATPAPRRLSRR